jgi:hypothetical protein
VLVLTVVGCGGSDGDPETSGAATDTGSEAPATPESAELARFAALDEGARQQELLEGSDEMWRTLLELSGLSEALGADQAVAVSTQLAADLAAAVVPLPEEVTVGGEGAESTDVPSTEAAGAVQLVALRAAPVAGVASAPAGQGIPAGSIGGLFIGAMEVALIGSALGSFVTDGESGSEQISPEAKVTATPTEVSFEAHHDFVADGVRLTAHNTLQVSPCPDADGRFSATGRVDVSMTTEDGRAGGRAELDLEITGQVDDDARLVSHEVQVRYQMGDFANGSGQFLDATGRLSASPGATLAVDGLTVNRASSKLTGDQAQAYSQLAMAFGHQIGERAVEGAQKGWESGNCVKLEIVTDPVKRTGLEPSTVVSVSVTPKAKDGTMAGGTVTAAVSGDGSVEPAGTKVAAPASFTYTAPDRVRGGGSVNLEARSRRGVGRDSVSFNTTRTRYRVTGGGNGLTVTGEIDDVSQPFELKGTFPGGSATFSYTPTSDRAGSVTYSGGGGGAKVTGSGTYTISEAEGGVLTLTQTTEGCADVGACRTNTEALTLTPIE